MGRYRDKFDTELVNYIQDQQYVRKNHQVKVAFLAAKVHVIATKIKWTVMRALSNCETGSHVTRSQITQFPILVELATNGYNLSGSITGSNGLQNGGGSVMSDHGRSNGDIGQGKARLLLVRY